MAGGGACPWVVSTMGSCSVAISRTAAAILASKLWRVSHCGYAVGESSMTGTRLMAVVTQHLLVVLVMSCMHDLVLDVLIS